MGQYTRSRIFFSLVATVVAVFALIHLNAFSKEKNGNKTYETEQQAKHEEYVLSLGRELEDFNSKLKAAAKEVENSIGSSLKNNSLEGVEDSLILILEDKTELDGLGICSTKENYAPYFVDPLSVRKGVLEYNYLEDTIKGSWYLEYWKNNWIQPYYGYSARKYVFEYVRPITLNSDTIFFIYADGSLNQLKDILEKRDFIKGELKYLVDPSGKILYSPALDNRLSVMGSMRNSQFISFDELTDSTSQVIVSDWLGMGNDCEFLLKQVDIPEVDWKLISMIPVKQIMKGQEKLVEMLIELVIYAISLIVLIYCLIRVPSYQNLIRSVALVMFLAILFQAGYIVWLSRVGYRYKKQEVLEETTMAGRQLEGTLAKLSNVIDRAEDLLKETLSEITTDVVPEESTRDIVTRKLQEVLGSNPDLFAVGFCWNADLSIPEQDLYSPFLTRDDFGMKDNIGQLPYDYRDESNQKGDWFRKFMALDSSGGILDPYFGYAADNVLIEYGRSIKNASNEVIGILYANYSLDDIKSILNTVNTGNTGFSYLTKNDAAAQVMYKPDSEFFEQVNRNYQSNPDDRQSHFPTLDSYAIKQNDKGNLQAFANQIKNGEFESNTSYLTEYKDYTLGQSFYRSFSVLEKLNWILVAIYPIHEVPVDYYQLRESIIMGLIYFFALIIVLPLSRSKNHNLDNILLGLKTECLNKNPDGVISTNAQLWTYSNYIAIVLFVAVASICVVTFKLNIPDYNLKNANKVFDQPGVEANVSNYFGTTKNIKQIPTGLTIENVQMEGISKVKISGLIWQKAREEDLGFIFTNAVSTTEKELSKTKEKDKDEWTKLSSFTAVIHQNFDYTHYPFDNKMITLEIRSPKLKNVALIPDFNSFRKDDLGQPITNPDRKISIDEDVSISRWIINRSFYSQQPYEWSAGNGNSESTNTKEKGTLMMNFNIVMNRNFLGAFIGEILPFLVISIFLFSLVMIMKKESQERIGYIDTAAALFFSLLFSHYKLRDFLQFKNVAFIEALYFILYVSIIGYVAIRFYYHDATKDYKILEFRKNLVSKIVYWPLLMFSVLLVSIIFFVILF